MKNIQLLTVIGVIMELGLHVLMIVDLEQKLEPGLVQTQLQRMEVQIVRGKPLNIKAVMKGDAQVNESTTLYNVENI